LLLRNQMVPLCDNFELGVRITFLLDSIWNRVEIVTNWRSGIP
jgi:hypothetical protein